jgi:hypothetical protein
VEPQISRRRQLAQLPSSVDSLNPPGVDSLNPPGSPNPRPTGWSRRAAASGGVGLSGWLQEAEGQVANVPRVRGARRAGTGLHARPGHPGRQLGARDRARGSRVNEKPSVDPGPQALKSLFTDPFFKSQLAKWRAMGLWRWGMWPDHNAKEHASCGPIITHVAE